MFFVPDNNDLVAFIFHLPCDLMDFFYHRAGCVDDGVAESCCILNSFPACSVGADQDGFVAAVFQRGDFLYSGFLDLGNYVFVVDNVSHHFNIAVCFYLI